jgi:hypothetical protein
MYMNNPRLLQKLVAKETATTTTKMVRRLFACPLTFQLSARP